MGDEVQALTELTGILRLQLDLLQAKSNTGNVSKSIANIDTMLGELQQERARINTPHSLDPLVPIKYLIERYFSLEEIDELAFESGVNPEQVAGVTLGERARELVLHADRNGQLPVLIGTCQVKRPFVDWPVVN